MSKFELAERLDLGEVRAMLDTSGPDCGLSR
jgi:hypothetical protein